MLNPIELILYIALNIYHEARSDPPFAQIAVAHVTINRIKQSGTSAKEVVYKPYQFSWVYQKENHWPDDIKSFAKSVEYAIIAINGHDFTDGSTFYYKKGTKKPYWTKEKIYVASFGSHKFYKEGVN